MSRTTKTQNRKSQQTSKNLNLFSGIADWTEFHILDLFCGTGGFSDGFEKYSEQFKIVCAIDILKDAALTIKANHPHCAVIQDDIRRIKPSYIKNLASGRKIDLVIGGPPCQGFSSLRPFRSSEDEDPRNNLFEQFALFVNYLRPKVFIMENVVGLLTFNNGATFKEIIKCFGDMRYKTDWRILNAANYGVPQKRERLILIGRQDGGPINFPLPTHSFDGKGIGYRVRSRMIIQTDGLPRALSTMDAIGDLPKLSSGQQITKYRANPKCTYQAERRKHTKELTLHIATNHNPKLLEAIKHAGENINRIPKHLIASGFSSCYSRMSPTKPANTITVKFTSPASSKCIHPFQDRAITPREAARIQSFDDDYLFCGSKTGIAYQIGNAVPPLLGKAIAEPVLEMLRDGA